MNPKRFYFVMIGLLVGLVAATGGGYYLAINRVNGDTETLKHSLAEAELADGNITQLTALQRQYQKIEPTLSHLDSALPRTKKQSEIMVQVQQLASSAGMSLPSAAFTATTGVPSTTTQTVADGDALVMPLNFQLAGSYEQLQAFLQSVEKLGRYTSITNLAITKSDKPKSLSFNISLNVYMKP